jgi:hypothetical protein
MVGSTSGLLLLNLLCLSLLIQWSHGDEHRLNYGSFSKMQDVQLASENWMHTWKIDIPEEIRIQTISYYDNRSSAASLNNVMLHLETLRQRTQHHMNTIQKLISNLVPDSHVIIGHPKRALLPFIGDIEQVLFGLAKQGDLGFVCKTH